MLHVALQQRSGFWSDSSSFFCGWWCFCFRFHENLARIVRNTTVQCVNAELLHQCHCIVVIVVTLIEHNRLHKRWVESTCLCRSLAKVNVHRRCTNTFVNVKVITSAPLCRDEGSICCAAAIYTGF